MAKGTAVFRFQPAQGIHRTAVGLDKAARDLRSIMLREIREFAPEIAVIFEDYAPYDFDERDDYHMADHIEVAIATAGRIRATVQVAARDPATGFDYLDVTRFGHRGRIRRKNKSWLKWSNGSETFFARETAGHHPRSDWVEDARPEVEVETDRIAAHLGRTVYTRVLR